MSMGKTPPSVPPPSAEPTRSAPQRAAPYHVMSDQSVRRTVARSQVRGSSRGSRATDPSVLAELDRYPSAQWIPRVRPLEPAPYRWVSGRIRDGLRFGVAVRIEDRRNRTLLVRLNAKRGWTSMWLTPGGGAERGETPREAIQREILEETGGRVHRLHLWKVYHETLQGPSRARVEWDFLQYVARWASGPPRTRVPHEIAEVRWFARLPRDMAFRADWLRK